MTLLTRDPDLLGDALLLLDVLGRVVAPELLSCYDLRDHQVLDQQIAH